MPKLFVDLDGVMADFYLGYEQQFGEKLSRISEWDMSKWEPVYEHPNFFGELPLMPDAMELWRYCEPFEPTILTGVPKIRQARVAQQKTRWVRYNLGPDVPIVCCPSKDKCLVAKPGDILIDDWEKWRHLWEAKGGIWITHFSAKESISRLKTYGFRHNSQ